MAEHPPEDSFDHVAYLSNVTSKPGVYRMIDCEDKILYVGKAKNLKNRLSSYFRTTGLTPKTQVMVSRIHHIEVTITRTEREALLLESNLIKEHRPRYNVLMRDDKSYPYIYISDNQAYPAIELHRGAQKRPGRYLGPYPNAGAVRETISLLQKTFRVRACEDSTFRNRSRPCLQHQIKRCSAPCVGFISEQQYSQDIEHAILFLEGRSQRIIEHLVASMENAADKQNYEMAARYRDQIAQLQAVAEKQHVSRDAGDTDVIACIVDADIACITVSYIRNGLNLGSRNHFPTLPEPMSEATILSAFLPQFYLDNEIPDEIICSHLPEDHGLICEVLGEQAERRIRLSDSVRSDRARWLEMTSHNAAIALQTRLLSRTGMLQRFEALQTLLKLDSMPRRLECFDISHTQGEETKASCVVFTPEGAYKNDYRRYNITGITGGDDYAAMRQALTRRYNRAADEQKLPDVLFIDGGKGQLRQAIEAFDELEIALVLIIGVAKGEGRRAGLEKLIFSDGRPDMHLDLDSAALKLILNLRDEAHRFAISGHRASRAKKRRESPLESIPGLGPKRRQTLLKHFGGLQGVTRAGVADLQNIPGISKKLAQSIYDAFHIQ